MCLPLKHHKTHAPADAVPEVSENRSQRLISSQHVFAIGASWALTNLGEISGLEAQAENCEGSSTGFPLIAIKKETETQKEMSAQT
jgi:hypothetical protein